MSRSQVERVVQWLERWWIWALALLVLVAHLLYLGPGGPALRHSGLMLVFDHDEATVFYDAFRVALGEAPYRDFFNFKGPVFGLVYGFAFWMGGAHWEVGQFVWILTDALTMWFTAQLMFQLAGRGFALFAVSFHAFAVVLVWPRPYEQWLAQLFIAAAMWLFVRPGEHTRRGSLIVGALLGLASMTALSMGLPVALAAMGLAFLRDWEIRPLRLRPALESSGLVAVGAFMGSALALLPTVARGALGAMYEQTVLWPQRAYVSSQPSVYGAGRAAVAAKLAELDALVPRLLGQASVGFITALPVILLVLVIILALVLVASRWLGPVRRHPAFLVVMLAGAAGAHLVMRGINRDITHLGFVALFALIALGAALSVPRARWPAPFRVVATGWAVLGLCSLLLFADLGVRTWGRSRALGTWREASLALFPYPDLVQGLKPEDTIVYGSFAPGYVYFHVRPSALPITNFPLNPQAWVGYYDQAQYQWLADGVFEKRPAVMAISGEQWDWLSRLRPELVRLYEKAPNSRRGYVELWQRRPDTP